MAWREYKRLLEKYEGDLSLATDREIEHADRGMCPELAKRLAEADYKRKERTKENERNTQHAAHSTKAAVGRDSRDNLLF